MKTRAKRKIHNLRSCSLDFVGSTLSQVPTIGITYDGQGDLDGNANNGTITSVSIIDPVGGGSFTAAQNCLPTAFNANDSTTTCVTQVDFTPGAVGAISADLEFQLQLLNEAPPDVQTIPLTCTGALKPVPSGRSDIYTNNLGVGTGYTCRASRSYRHENLHEVIPV